jgi:5-methylcytosine-specific restriction endonuclease McrA
MIANRPVLMIDKSYQAYDAKPLADAFADVIGERAQFVDESYALYTIDEWLQLPVDGHASILAVTQPIRVPEIMRFSDYKKDYNRVKVVFSRKNLWRRDGYRCQYCGRKPRFEDLTVDHVIPQSRGGISSFPNCVLACVQCNLKKGGRTPEEAGMKLRRLIRGKDGTPQVEFYYRPKHPSWSPIYSLPKMKDYPTSWKSFFPSQDDQLYWDVELQP